MIDTLLRDDLYEELVFDLSEAASISEGMAHELAEIAERHADVRTARAIRVLALHFRSEPVDQAVVTFLEECADRVDPDVNTKVDG